MRFDRVAVCILGLVLVPALAGAETRLHSFESVAISPDAKRVVAVESTDPGALAVAAATRRIVIRTIAGGRSVTLRCPLPGACNPSSPVWSPDGSRLAYIVRNSKAATSAVWLVGADGRRPRPWLQPFAGILAAPRWSADGRALALLVTAGAHKEIGATQAGAALTGEISATLAQDVQRIAVLETGATSLRFASPADLFVYEYDWLPRGRNFVATAAHGNGDDNWWIAKLYRIDGARRSAAVLYTPALQINAPRVSPDGATVAFISGLMSDFGSVGGDVYVMPVAGGTATDITPGMRASADALDWNGSNRRITFTGLRGAAAVIAAVDVVSKAIVDRWSGQDAIAADGRLDVAFSRSADTTAVVRQSFERPPEIATGPIGAWTTLTHENAALTPAVRARSISWSNEGFTISGWLLEPRRLRPGKVHPMVVQIHGGPSAAARPRYTGRGDIKDLIDRGYFVFLPNPRGSYGQGERFTAANVRDFGYGDLRDVLAGVGAVERSAPVDDRRLGIMGWSYGGYMTMWAVTQTHRFRAAVAGAGIANWQSYYGQNGIDRWMTPFFGATVYADPAVYAKSSPITFIKQVKTPTLVVVGERDVECPAPQSLEFWHALTTLGVPSSLVIYAGEGHGIRKPANRADITHRTLAWFKRYLGT